MDEERYHVSYLHKAISLSKESAPHSTLDPQLILRCRRFVSRTVNALLTSTPDACTSTPATSHLQPERKAYYTILYYSILYYVIL